MFFIKLGAVLLFVGLVFYFVNKYDEQILEFFQKIFPRQSKEEETMEDEKNSSKSFDTDDSSDSRSVSETEQFEQLKSDSFVEFNPDPSKPIMKEFMVTGTGILFGLRHLGNGNFQETDDRSPLFILDDGKYFIIKLKDGRWVAFNEEITIQDNSASEFNSNGEKFTKGGQLPDSCIFKWRNMSLSVMSVGYAKYRHVGGKSHLANQVMVKFMVARRQSDDAIFYLENVKAGTDRVWLGQDLGYNLDRYLGRILTKE